MLFWSTPDRIANSFGVSPSRLVRGRADSVLAHNSAADMPARCSFRIPIICSFEYRLRFIVCRPSLETDPSFSAVEFQGATSQRTLVVGAFPDGQSCLNLAAARLRNIAGTQWSTRKYMNMDPLYAAHGHQNGAVVA